MNENYIVINGKRLDLTEEQLKQLGIEPEKKRKNPFERVTEMAEYYCIKIDGIDSYRDYGDSIDNALYEQSNYFNDKDFAKQVALHQLLYRKLLKFAYDNGGEDVAWNQRNSHWQIFYNYADERFDVGCNDGFKHQSVYFASLTCAECAIKEVIEPFMKEHPEFVW